MTPQEKAEELIEKFTMDNTRQGERNGIKCALIAVDELIADCSETDNKLILVSFNYWNEVKQEILKLKDINL